MTTVSQSVPVTVQQQHSAAAQPAQSVDQKKQTFNPSDLNLPAQLSPAAPGVKTQQGVPAINTQQVGPRFPTRDQLVRMYRSMVESGRQAGTLERLDGPPVAKPHDYPAYDITPKGMMDVHRMVFVIDDVAYLQTSSLFGPNGGPYAVWEKVGPVPSFAPQA